MSLMNTYGERSTTLVKGEGAYLWDDQGRRYLDALSGIAVCGLGHANPIITEAITAQASTLVHASNLFNLPPQQQLGEKLVTISGMDNAFFGNSGAEANEAAIKIARKFGHDNGIDEPEIIVADNSFHGRTMATLSATGNPKVKKGFSPLVSGFVHTEFNNIDAIKAVATKNTVAVMVEPIQGEGGIRVPADDYLKQLRALCDQNEWLLILDEIQTGAGRTGKFFAYQHSDILPDIVTSAKGLANGVPIGVCLARAKAAGVLQPGNHGSTFGGNPLACAAALATVTTVCENGYLARAQELGEKFLAQFREKLSNNAHVIDIRGMGLLIGIELDRDCGELVDICKEAGLILNVTAGSTIRLLPPLILTDEQADEIINLVVNSINGLLN